MSGYNNSLWYYKMYYADQDNETINWLADSKDEKNKQVFDRRNKALYASLFPALDHSVWAYPTEGITSLQLVTTYPGLLLGSGLSHGSGLLGELKLGFFFDYTTGLPVIAGSSVKGVLRSAFPAAYKAGGHAEKAAQVLQLIQYYLKEITGKDWPKEAVAALETFLFGTFKPGEASNPKPGSIIFHDAVPVNANRVKLNNTPTRRYLADDYITPHKSKDPIKVPHALVNPIPVAFLKVLPGVEFRFQFVLQDFYYPTKNDEQFELEKDKIAELFKILLLELGTGAKTNVGYGRWVEAGVLSSEPEKGKKEASRKPQKEQHYPGGQHQSGQQSEHGKGQHSGQQNQHSQGDKPATSEPKLPKQYHSDKLVDSGEQLTGIIVGGPKKRPNMKRILFIIKGKESMPASDDIQSFPIGTLVTATVTTSKLKNEVTQITNPVTRHNNPS